MPGPVVRSLVVAFGFAALPAPPVAAQALLDDGAQVVDAAAEARLGAMLGRLETETGARLAVVAASTLADRPIGEVALRTASERKADVLLLLAPVEREMRIEVAPPLLPLLDEAFCNETARLMVPSLTAGRFEEALLIGAVTIEARLRKAAGAA